MKNFLLRFLNLLVLSLFATQPSLGQDRNLQFSGRLESTDPQFDDRSYYDLYRFAAQAGDEVTIDMVSSSFDAFVLLLDSSGVVVSQNDDVIRGNTNAQIRWTFNSSGEHIVVANSYGAEERGDYLITINYREITQAISAGWDGMALNNMGAILRGQQSLYLNENRFTNSIEELRMGIPDETDGHYYRFTHIDPSRMVQFVAQPKDLSLNTYVGVAYSLPDGRTTYIACESNETAMEPPPRLSPNRNGDYSCPPGYSSIR